MIISSCATKYLHVERQHDSQNSNPIAPLLSSPIKEGDGTSDTLATEIRAILAPKMEKYGLDLDRIEVQEVRLPQGIQDAIDRVWKATLLPAQTSQEAEARYKQIRAELEAVKDVIGVDATAMDRILKNIQGGTFIGLPLAIEQLLASFVQKSQQEIPKIAGSKPPLTLSPPPS